MVNGIPGAPEPLPEAVVTLVARRFQVLAEPVRIRLLDRLRAGERSVGELALAVGCSQQNVSRHLAVLGEAGVVARRKQGTRAYYRIADPTVLALCEEVCGALRAQVRSLSSLLESAA
jgi:DNA-binding transcriptional ArsR family regulator